MKHIQYSATPSVAIFIKENALNDTELRKYYPIDNSIVFGLPDNVDVYKLLPYITGLGINTLYVLDAKLFKKLSKQTKADVHIGYVLPCKLKGFEHLKVIYGVNYRQCLYNPNQLDRLNLSVDTLNNHLKGTYTNLGDNVIQTAYYDDNLNRLHQYPMIVCDIETTGLKLGSKILSIAFAWDKHSGMVFKVNDTKKIKEFFEEYKGIVIYHNATFDIKHIIYNCFMKNNRDMYGLIYGLKTMCKQIHDTKVITYLATNNTQGNQLGLKELSHEYVGNYAIDFNQNCQAVLLEYNLLDTLATWFVFDKYYPLMCKDNQETIYKELMIPSLKVIIEMELIGLPIDINQVKKARDELEGIFDIHYKAIISDKAVLQAEKDLQLMELISINSKLKTKQHTLDKVKDYSFNANSNKHLQHLLYKVLGLPITDYTDSKQPSTSSSTLEKYKDKHTVITHLLERNKCKKILTTYIPAMLEAFERDNHHYLQGSFNLNGTVSGRMSSNNPNLQNIPSNSVYGKVIKKCFKAPKGFIFVGADFSSLEDYVNALVTRDPNKLKVYTDGYDSHCLRAYYYFKDRMPDITDTVESINSIKTKYPELRQLSKAPSFALAYGGSYLTLMDNGFSEEEAKQIEKNYHELYKQSDNWVKDKIQLATKQGYIDSAFGLRIRTPVLSKTVLDTTKTPKEATKEARTLGNAISGQSYGLLTNRAVNAFMELVWAKYPTDIFPVALIHDAIYLLIKDDLSIVKWVNDNLIKCMQWQELKELKHDTVKLSAQLDLYYPDWSNPITLKNNMSKLEIKQLVNDTLYNLS